MFVLVGTELLLPFLAVIPLVPSFARTVCAAHPPSAPAGPSKVCEDLIPHTGWCSLRWVGTDNALNIQLGGMGAPNPCGFSSNTFPCGMLNEFFICIKASSEIAVAESFGSALLG